MLMGKKMEKCVNWKINKNVLNTTFLPSPGGKTQLSFFFPHPSRNFLHIYEHFKHTHTHKWFPAIRTVLPMYLGYVSASANVD